jgi:hypothetical protein
VYAHCNNQGSVYQWQVKKQIHGQPKSNFHNCSLDVRCGTEGNQVNGHLFDKQQSCLYVENEVPPTSPLATQLQQYSHLQFIWKTSFLYFTLRKILIGVTLKSNRKLLPLLKTIQSKFKQNDKFLQSILLLYFYIDLYNMKEKKQNFMAQDIVVVRFFCQKIWEENNVSMLHNMTPLKTDITE